MLSNGNPISIGCTSNESYAIALYIFIYYMHSRAWFEFVAMYVIWQNQNSEILKSHVASN